MFLLDCTAVFYFSLLTLWSEGVGLDKVCWKYPQQVCWWETYCQMPDLDPTQTIYWLSLWDLLSTLVPAFVRQQKNKRCAQDHIFWWNGEHSFGTPGKFVCSIINNLTTRPCLLTSEHQQCWYKKAWLLPERITMIKKTGLVWVFLWGTAPVLEVFLSWEYFILFFNSFPWCLPLLKYKQLECREIMPLCRLHIFKSL